VHLGEDDQNYFGAGNTNVYAGNTSSLVFRYFAGKIIKAADNGGSAGHKEINRTTLRKIVQGLKQMLYKNSLKSFD
jgi:sucrose phosphorylase